MKMSMLGTGTELAFTTFLIWNKFNQIKLSGWFKFVQIFQLRTEYLLHFFFLLFIKSHWKSKVIFIYFYICICKFVWVTQLLFSLLLITSSYITNISMGKIYKEFEIQLSLATVCLKFSWGHFQVEFECIAKILTLELRLKNWI